MRLGSLKATIVGPAVASASQAAAQATCTRDTVTLLLHLRSIELGTGARGNFLGDLKDRLSAAWKQQMRLGHVARPVRERASLLVIAT